MSVHAPFRTSVVTRRIIYLDAPITSALDEILAPCGLTGLLAIAPREDEGPFSTWPRGSMVVHVRVNNAIEHDYIISPDGSWAQVS